MINLQNAKFGDRFKTANCGEVIFLGLNDQVQNFQRMEHPYTFIHKNGLLYYFENGQDCSFNEKWELIEKIT